MPQNYQETLQSKRLQASQTKKEQDELMAMVRELRKVQTASLMGQSKPSVVLTDQTDLGDRMKEQTVKLVEAIGDLKDKAQDEKELDSLEEIKQAVLLLEKSYEQMNKQLISAIQAIKVSPTVNVPPLPVPKIMNEVDLRPLERTMRELFPEREEKLDLSCYRAQDLMDKGDMQYVGFLNPDGDWYIIENNITDNTMRYVFGSGNYAKAFKQATTYEYQLLSEAVNG